MVEMDAFERQVADVARRVAGPPLPVDALAIAQSARSHTSARLSRPRVTVAIPARWRWRTALGLALLTAILLVALIGSALLIGGVQSTPPPAEDAVGPLLPAEIPATIPHGTIDTPIGPARWVHLSGDPTTLPGPLRPMPGPTGLLWFDGGGDMQFPCEGSGELECLSRPQLWASADAISERVERPLPVVAEWATLTPLDGTWWLGTSGPTTLWRSTDAETWEQVDLGALVSPGPAELDWEIRLGEPATAGGTTVVPVIYEARDGGRLLGRPDLGSFVWPELSTSDAYRVMADTQGGDVDVGEVRIEETATGLRFSYVAGNAIATLDGADLGFIEAWASTGAILDYDVALVEGGAASPVDLPGPPLYDNWDDGPTLFGTDAGFHAFKSAADGTVRNWRSDDGRDWTEGRPLGGVEGDPWDVGAQIHVVPRWGRPSTVRAVDTERGRFWESEDGLTWNVSPVSPMGEAPHRLGGGWLQGADGRWWASVDGTTWIPAPTVLGIITKWETAGQGSSGVAGVIGETLFAFTDEKEGDRQRDLWVLEFDEVPTEGGRG